MKSRLYTFLVWFPIGLFLRIGLSAQGDIPIVMNPAAGILWEHTIDDFTLESYNRGVASLFVEFEKLSGRRFVPGQYGRAGLKLFTSSGPGLATSRHLVLAVIRQLENRGFRKDQIFILDQSARDLRRAGFLPQLSKRRSDFHGIPVLAMDSGIHFHPDWFYESPLPSFPIGEVSNDDRKSLLPYPLINEVDFWINLPVATDCPGVGISCSLANASIWNVQNNYRFIADKNSAPVAVTEICAIPELRATWAFSLVSLETYQFIGGPRFHSLYTASEKSLALSSNPVLLDYHLLTKINQHRRANRFKEIPSDSPLFRYGKTLGLGEFSGENVKTLNLR